MVKSNPRQELLKIEKKIFLQNQQAINDSTDVSDKGFKKYYRRYKRAVKNYQRTSDVQKIEKDVSQSRVVLCGDFHTLDQSQRSFVRLLRGFIRSQHKKIIVTLETVHFKYQKYLDQFMASTLTGEEFIKKIGFKKHWFFDLWENYTVIFDFLKYHKISVQAIDADPEKQKGLMERDKFMAARIADLAQKNPDHIIFVLVGDLHLAPAHLPREIKKAAAKIKMKLPTVTVYQNSPEIYWKLSEKDLVDHTLIVKIRDKEYCRMHTPPIIVQQSYVNWLYHEEGNFDWIDAKSSFVTLVQHIAQIIGAELPKDYENVEVYTCGDLGFLKVLRNKKLFSKKELKFIHNQISNSQSYFMPQARMAYIANVSIHHAAEEGSHYLKFLLSGLEIPRTHRDAFYANVLHEAIGFFGSKLVNAKRKCARYSDFVAEQRYLERANLAAENHVFYETSLLFLKHEKLAKKNELMHTNKIMNLSQNLFLSITHAIGYDLGDRLYYGFMAGKISKEQIRKLYVRRFDDEGEPGQIYLELFSDLKSVKRPAKI